jgi:hypothetical protein
MTMLAAALVFGVSAVVFGATVVDAVRVGASPVAPEVAASPDVVGDASTGGDATSSSVLADPEGAVPHAAAPNPTNEQRPLQGIVYPRVTATEILGAVNQDLFQPDRTPSLTPYLLPSERPAPVQESRNDRRQRQPSLKLVGTAIAGDMALALIQTEDSLPVVFMLGETVEGYTLAMVTEESITLTQGEAEFTYPVVEPDRGRQSSDANNRDARGRNTNADQEAAVLQQRLQAAMQSLQQGGRAGLMRGGMVPGQGGATDLPPGTIILQGLPGQAGGRTTVTVRGRGGGGGGGGIQ